MKLGYKYGTKGNEYTAHYESTEYSPEKNLILKFIRDTEVGENQEKDKDIVNAQWALD